MPHFIDKYDFPIKGGLEIFAWKGGVGKKLLWRKSYNNLVVNLARRVNSRVIGGQDAINAYFAAIGNYPTVTTTTWGNIQISNINQVFIEYMKWSYDAASTDPQLTDEALDGTVVDDITGTYNEVQVLPYYPSTSQKAVTFRACIGSIPASVSGMSTMLVPVGTQLNQEGIFARGDNVTPIRLLFAKRLYDILTVGDSMVLEYRHTIVY